MPDVIDALKVVHRNSTPPTPLDIDDSIRRGRRRRRRRRIASTGVGLGVTAGIVLAALVLPGDSPETPEPAGEMPFAILEEPQRKIDELPPSVRREQSMELDPSSTRLIGQYEGSAYWLATGETGDFCVVSAEDGAWIGTGCGGILPVNVPYAPELSELLVTSYGYTESGFDHTHVFPDDVDLEIAGHAGLVFLSDNLAIRSVSERGRQELAGVLESAAEYFSVFGERQNPPDLLPEVNDRADLPFDDFATRYVGEFRGVRYWMSVLEADSPQNRQICLIGVTGSGQWRGSTCSDPLDPSSGGPQWPLERTDPEDATRLALVPDDYELTDEQADTWERVAPNLYYDTAPE